MSEIMITEIRTARLKSLEGLCIALKSDAVLEDVVSLGNNVRAKDLKKILRKIVEGRAPQEAVTARIAELTEKWSGSKSIIQPDSISLEVEKAVAEKSKSITGTEHPLLKEYGFMEFPSALSEFSDPKSDWYNPTLAIGIDLKFDGKKTYKEILKDIRDAIQIRWNREHDVPSYILKDKRLNETPVKSLSFVPVEKGTNEKTREEHEQDPNRPLEHYGDLLVGLELYRLKYGWQEGDLFGGLRVRAAGSGVLASDGHQVNDYGGWRDHDALRPVFRSVHLNQKQV